MRTAAVMKVFAFFLALGYTIFRKRRNRNLRAAEIETETETETETENSSKTKDAADESAECLIVDQNILAEAELAVARPIEEQRRTLAATHELWLHLSTYQGATVDEVENVIGFLKNNGIGAEVLFESALTPRAGRSMKMMGLFEIYVPRQDIPAADRLIDKPRTLGQFDFA